MSQARVTSIDAIADFRASLLTCAAQVRDALDGLSLETRRALEWIEERQPTFWEHEVRRRQELVLEAKKALHMCRSRPKPGGGHSECIEEKKALARAQFRLQRAEEKKALTRQWAVTLDREIGEYQARSGQLAAWLDADFPNAVRFLDQALRALEAYASIHFQQSGAVGGAAGGAASMIRPAPEGEPAPPAQPHPTMEAAADPSAADASAPADRPAASHPAES